MVFDLNPFKLHSNDVHVICPKNKPFFAETLKAEKAVAEPPMTKIGKADALILSFDLTSTQGSPIIR
jgi:hypothetical protein